MCAVSMLPCPGVAVHLRSPQPYVPRAGYNTHQVPASHDRPVRRRARLTHLHVRLAQAPGALGVTARVAGEDIGGGSEREIVVAATTQ